MSLDRSLKAGSTLKQHRNVLTRAERIARLVDGGEFDLDKSDPLNIRKVVNRKLSTGKKSGKKEATEEATEDKPAEEKK